jgi:SAM-dependent methyltransferase
MKAMLRQYENKDSDIESWGSFVKQLDERLCRAIVDYEQEIGGCSASEMADAFNEILKMGKGGGGGDARYNRRGVPIAYALHDAPRRVATVVLALYNLVRKAELVPPTNILDIGSGLDAVTLSLEYSGFIAEDHRIVCCDPSPYMTTLARNIDTSLRRAHKHLSVEQIMGAGSVGAPFDAIFLSYAFQYRHNDGETTFFQELASFLKSSLRLGGFVVVCSPNAKARAANMLIQALSAMGNFWLRPLKEYSPPHLMNDAPMSGISEMLAERLRICRYSGLKPYAQARLLQGELFPRLGSGPGIRQIEFAAIRRY